MSPLFRDIREPVRPRGSWRQVHDLREEAERYKLYLKKRMIMPSARRVRDAIAHDLITSARETARFALLDVVVVVDDPSRSRSRETRQPGRQLDRAIVKVYAERNKERWKRSGASGHDGPLGG